VLMAALLGIDLWPQLVIATGLQGKLIPVWAVLHFEISITSTAAPITPDGGAGRGARGHSRLRDCLALSG